jgi:hypothetical protein
VDQITHLDDEEIVGYGAGGGVGSDLLEAPAQHPGVTADVTDDGDAVWWQERHHAEERTGRLRARRNHTVTAIPDGVAERRDRVYAMEPVGCFRASRGVTDSRQPIALAKEDAPMRSIRLAAVAFIVVLSLGLAASAASAKMAHPVAGDYSLTVHWTNPVINDRTLQVTAQRTGKPDVSNASDSGVRFPWMASSAAEWTANSIILSIRPSRARYESR